MLCHKTYVTPQRPFEKLNPNQKLKLIGKHRLWDKLEVWRVKFTLAKTHRAFQKLLILD